MMVQHKNNSEPFCIEYKQVKWQAETLRDLIHKEPHKELAVPHQNPLTCLLEETKGV